MTFWADHRLLEGILIGAAVEDVMGRRRRSRKLEILGVDVVILGEARGR